MMKDTLLGALCLSAAASIWGSMYVVSKYVLDYIPPVTLVWLRYVVGFTVLYAILKYNERKSKAPQVIRRRDWLLTAWIGFIGYFVSISLQFIGTKLSDAHTGALITCAIPVFIVIFARIILKEPLTVKKIGALALAGLGVLIVVGGDIEAQNYLLGCVILIGASLTWGLLSVYVKIAAKYQPTLTITTYGMMFAILFTTPFMIWETRSVSLVYHQGAVLPGVLYLGTVCTAGALFLWNKGMELMEAGIGSIFFFFQPVVGAVLGWLLLNEKLKPSFFAGGILLIIGVIIASAGNDKK